MGFFDKIQDTINTAAEQTKVKSQDVQLKRDRKQKLEMVGEQVYNLYLNGQLSLQELVPACEAVAEIDRQLQEVASQMEAARPQQPGVPPQAGEAAPPPQAPAAQQGTVQPPAPQAQAPAPPPAAPQAPAGGNVPPPPPPMEEQ